VSVMFEPAIDSAAQIEFTALDDSASASGEINLTPLRVVNARETRRSAALAISDDIELREIELAGAQARAPGQIEEELLALMFGDAKSRPGRLRPYLLKSDVALKFGMVQVADSRPLVNVFNRVTLGEELETLQTVVTAKPRQGRIREIGVRLLLPSPDPGAAARLKTSGPVRRTRVEPDGDAALRITAELDAPSAQTVSVSFSLDQPLNAAAGTAPRAAVMLPSETDGARSFLLIHRAFEGELSPLDLAGGRAADPAEIAWPDANFGFLPSDLVYELSSGAKAGPSFSIQRHARQATLHAVVESLRNRTIITPDGVERNELEIVLQNESEQFLKVALPYERSRVTLYETLVAGKSVRTAFVKEGNREALAIPLIRTGLLEPELTVRVAYTVTGGAPMKRSGRREQRLPDILGGVPVTESALVLMLPSEFDYDKFEGSLDQVELVDLELDEAARKARTSEKLSQAALYSTGEVQRAAYSKLNDYQTAVNSEIKSAKTTYGAQSRMGQTIGVGGGTKGQAFQRAREAKLGTERAQKLKQAETSALNGVSNLSQIAQNVGGQTLNVAGSSDQEAGNITAPSPAIPRPGQAFTILPTTTPALEFPRVGDVLVFRQLQGTGAINFKYSSRETSGRRSDSLLGIGLVILAAGLIYRGGAIMATRRRVALAIMLPALAALAFGVLIDLAVPILIAGIILLMRRPPSSRTA
ncbi:hypothetical protein HYR69_07155, partial [Candidatus Sumerlaeota bacterium]|nr:hypothetical protein [Candidatus Sumerlaeota bacterium]